MFKVLWFPEKKHPVTSVTPVHLSVNPPLYWHRRSRLPIFTEFVAKLDIQHEKYQR